MSQSNDEEILKSAKSDAVTDILINNRQNIGQYYLSPLSESFACIFFGHGRRRRVSMVGACICCRRSVERSGVRSLRPATRGGEGDQTAERRDSRWIDGDDHREVRQFSKFQQELRHSDYHGINGGLPVTHKTHDERSSPPSQQI